MPKTPEGRLKAQIRSTLKNDPDVYFTNVPAEGVGAIIGSPDIIACVKGKDGKGYFLGIEAKALYGRPSDMQLKRKEQIENAGGMWIKPRTVQEVIDAINILKGI